MIVVVVDRSTVFWIFSDSVFTFVFCLESVVTADEGLKNET
jgi:hypothetical protein